MVAVRRAQLADHDALVELWVDAGLGRIGEEEWNALIAHPAAVIFVAEDGEQMVGAAVAFFDGWRAYINHLAVAAAHRRRGVAKDLLQEAESFLFREGARSIYVIVHQDNTAGLALSASMGYVPEGELVLVKPAPEQS